MAIRGQRLKVGNENIDLTEVFPAALRRIQTSVPKHDSKIANLMEFFAWEFIGMGKRFHGGQAGLQVGIQS